MTKCIFCCFNELAPELTPEKLRKHYHQFLTDYCGIWNDKTICPCGLGSELVKESVIERLGKFVQERCENRFGFLGPEGMYATICARRKAFPDFILSLEDFDIGRDDEGQTSLDVRYRFTGIYEGSSVWKRGTPIDVRATTKYLLSPEGLIIGGSSNLRQIILSELNMEAECLQDPVLALEF